MNEQDTNSPLSHLLEVQPEPEELAREQSKKKAILGEFDEAFEGIHFHHCNYCGADYDCDPIDEKCFSPQVYPCHTCRRDGLA